MKIGIERGCRGYDRYGEDVYNKIKEHGFDCIDYGTASDDMWIYNLSGDDFLKKATRERELLKRAGIEVSQVHGPWRYPPKDETSEDIADRMHKMKKSMEFASILGCKNWVIHPLMPYGIQDKGTEFEQKTWDSNLKFMTDLVKIAREYDITICLENMPFKEFSLSKPSDILRLVKTINDDRLMVCLDTGHINVFEELSPADAVKELAPYLKALHIHDNDGRDDYHCIPYFGTVNWKNFIKALKESAVDVTFSFEVNIPPDVPSPAFEEMNKSLAVLGRTMVAM